MSELSENKFIQKWLEGNATEEEKTNHLEKHDLSSIADAVEKVSAMEPVFKNSKSDSWANIQQKINRNAEKTVEVTLENKKPANYTSWWLAAASVVVIVGAFFLLRTNPTIHQTSFGEIAKIELPDGSIVHLGPKSELSYMMSDWESESMQERVVQLKGEAYFKVKKGEKFTVETEFVNTSVLGTSFLVKTHHEMMSNVDCVEGKIIVESNSRENHQEIVEGGTSVDITSGEISKPYKHISANVLGWLDGKYHFDNTSLTHVVSTIERLYGVQVRFENQDVASLFYSGFVEKGDIEESLDIVCLPLSLKYRKENNVIMIYK